jgi:xanthine dehydrogenase/oxidase
MAVANVPRLPLIIDTDVDIDDWMAILYSLAHPRVEVKGITVVGTGAAHLEPGGRNALNLLMIAGKPEVPVALGLARPMAYDHQFPPDIRQPVDDLYGIHLPPRYHNPRQPLPDAIAFLEKTLATAATPIAILAIGPLTNLGTLLSRHPDLAPKIARIYIMGGAIEVPGNVHAADPAIPNRVAEWNLYLDPVAADVVLRSGVPITLAPLDATRFVPVTTEFYLRLLKNRVTPSADFIYQALGHDFDFLESGNFFFWDPLAAVLATDPDIGEARRLALAVHTPDDDRSGQLLVDGGGTAVQVYLEVERPAFEDLFLETLNGRKSYKSEVTFLLDDREITLENVSPQTLLIDFLHLQEVDRRGTKLSCGEGGCGACTVMLTTWDAAQGKLVRRAVNSCLRPVATLDGAVVTTVQGLGSVKTALDPVQHALAANNGSQCGYCSPGFVMNMYSLLQNRPSPTEREIEDVFDGNICRCTGYRPILAGFKKFACDYRPPEHPAPIVIDPQYDAPVKPWSEYEPPPEFLAYMKDPQPVAVAASGYSYFRPLELAEVYRLKAQYGPAPGGFKLLTGNTQVGIYKTRPVYQEEPVDPQVMVDVSQVPELGAVTVDDRGITVGGAVTLARLIEVLDQAVANRPRDRTRGPAALRKHLLEVANTQVRNVGSVAGNLHMAVNLGFLSDLLVVLGALDATVTVSTPDERREIPVLELPPDRELPAAALYAAVHIPWSAPGDRVETFKIRRRTDDSHAIVNAAFVVRLDGAAKVETARLVLGGIAADYAPDAARHGSVPFRPIRLPVTERYLEGRPWTRDTLRGALVTVDEEVQRYAPPEDPRGRPLTIDQIPFAYRADLARTLFFKFFIRVALEVAPGEVPPEFRSAGLTPERPVSAGIQTYNSYPAEEPVSLPLVKLEAFLQTAGEALYSHDVVLPPGTLEAAYVYSLIPRGTFHYQLPVTSSHGERGQRVDAAQLEGFLADWFEGFEGYVTYVDLPVPELNWIGEASDDPVFVPSEDDEIPAAIAADQSPNFHPREITTLGAPLGLVLARDPTTAVEIATFVRNQCIAWNPLPAVQSLAEAITQESFFEQDPPTNPAMTHIPEITRPGSDEGWLADPSQPLEQHGCRFPTVTGTQRTGYQNHFYMETMGTVAVPGEDRSLTLHTSTQTLADNQNWAADVLGLPTNAVRVLLRRDGGAFGGKQSRSRFNSTATAVAAYTRNRPVRLLLDRNTNFVMCGNRHPFAGSYAAAYGEDGTIQGLAVDFFSDGGNTYDLSFPVMDLALLNSDNAYQFLNFRSRGQVCQTHQLSSTAFRSFGTIQCVNVVETALEHVAHALGKRPEEVREKNLYRDGTDAWTRFEITDQTLAVLATYQFPPEVMRELAGLKGQVFPDQKSFAAALEALSPFLAQQANRLLVESYSTLSYDFTPYLQGLPFCDIRTLWARLKESSDFATRAAAVERYNRENRFTKRGISMIPLKYGISYTDPRGMLNQGGAYVIAYANDGSVLVQHGGVESGQGIQTKMAQIAAQTLGIPLELIRMGDTDTTVISDASPTAASTGSDLNGGAVALACRILRQRLEKFCEDLGQYTDYFLQFDPTVMDQEQKIDVDLVVRNWRTHWAEVWPTLISLANLNRINLASEARYKTPHYEAVDLAHPFGTPFFYYTYGAAAAEVEVDCLTGDFTLLRADVLFDVGKSLNPLLDVGQMEGGFVQGVGNMTTEELLFQTPREAPRLGYPPGAITSFGTWDYKPPGAKTIPIDFRVALLDNSGREIACRGPRLQASAVKSSKGIGEPPLVLANTVFFAIRQAIAAFRRDQGHPEWFPLHAPATVARIREACAVGELAV